MAVLGHEGCVYPGVTVSTRMSEQDTRNRERGGTARKGIGRTRGSIMNVMERTGDSFLAFPYDCTSVHEEWYRRFSDERSTVKIIGTHFVFLEDFFNFIVARGFIRIFGSCKDAY
jgi:hypothetical protein